MPPANNEPANWKLRVRIYKQGLGDCFLLTFKTSQGLRHMLIDCGVFVGKERMRKVAKNIDTVTGSKLDLLVASHEHWDHISGFLDAHDIFDPMTIREIWVGWTEDPEQEIVKEKKELNQLRLSALQMALAKISDLPEEDQRRGGAIAEVLGFFGGISGIMAFSEKTEAAMNKITLRDPAPKYCEPGEVIEPDWLPGVRIYVLAPPKDVKDIKYKKQEFGTEMYHLGGPDYSFRSALEKMLGVTLPEGSVTPFFPFDRNIEWPDSKNWNRSGHYFADTLRPVSPGAESIMIGCIAPRDWRCNWITTQTIPVWFLQSS